MSGFLQTARPYVETYLCFQTSLAFAKAVDLGTKLAVDLAYLHDFYLQRRYLLLKPFDGRPPQSILARKCQLYSWLILGQLWHSHDDLLVLPAMSLSD